jgi:hypothetical protein
MYIRPTSARATVEHDFYKCRNGHILDRRTQHRRQTRQVDTPKESRTFITAGDPCICPVNHLFCARNHENENGPDPGLVRSLDEAGNARVHVHARSVHEVESSRPTWSRCADDTAPGTPDDLCRHIHSGRHDHRADRRPCASEMEAAMASGCHLALRCGESRRERGDWNGKRLSTRSSTSRLK